MQLNGTTIPQGQVIDTLHIRQRLGQLTIRLLCKVMMPTPLPGEHNRKTPYTIPVAAVRSMSEVHRQRFKDAVRKVAHRGVSVWSRSMLKATHLQRLVNLHRAAATADYELLERLIGHFPDINAQTSDGTSLLGAACRSGGREAAGCVALLLAHKADAGLAEGPRLLVPPGDDMEHSRGRRSALLARIKMRPTALHIAAAYGHAHVSRGPPHFVGRWNLNMVKPQLPSDRALGGSASRC